MAPFNPDDSGIAPLSLDDDSLRKLADYVEATGRSRKASRGTLDEYDFLCGAMAVYFALGLQGKIPASWIFSAFTGDDPLSIEEDAEEEVDYADMPHRCELEHDNGRRGALEYDGHVGYANHMRQWHDRVNPIPDCYHACSGLT